MNDDIDDDATMIRLSSMRNLKLMETYSSMKTGNSKDQEKGRMKKSNEVAKQTIEERTAKAQKKRRISIAKVKKEFGQVMDSDTNPLYRPSSNLNRSGEEDIV